jgi:hypothetical protein
MSQDCQDILGICARAQPSSTNRNQMLPPGNSHGNRPPVDWNLPEARCTACSGLTKMLKTKEKSAGLAGLKKKVQFL